MKSNPRGQRRGGVLLAVLVVMMVASLLFGAMLKSCHEEQLLARRQQWDVQAQELVQSGLERAAARLARNPAYKTETWRLSAAELGGREDALVEIAVLPLPEEEHRRRIQVVVDYPQTPERRVRHRGEVLIDLPKED